MRILITPALALALASPADAIEISNFRSGLACTHSSPAQSGRGWICHVTEDIPVTDQGRCVFDGQEQPCTWYGFEFDYRGARAGDALQCEFSQSEPGRVGNPEDVLAKEATGGTFELVLDEAAGHVFNPQFHTFDARRGGVPLTIRGSCSFEHRRLFEYTARLRFPELPADATDLRLFTPPAAARGKATGGASGGRNPTVVSAPAPVYPSDLAASGIGGTTELHLSLDATGAITDIRVVKSAGHPRLDEAVVETAHTWRFRPAEDADGVAVASKIRMPVCFEPPLTAARTVPQSFEFDGKKPSIIRRPAPRYPPELKAAGVEGTTQLRLAIDATGTVSDVHIAKSSGHPLLDDSAVQAARTWRYTPAEDTQGAPAPSMIEAAVSFELQR